MFFATPDKDWDSWDYIVGDYLKVDNDKKMFSISVWRRQHLQELSTLSNNTMLFSCKDPGTGNQTKWIDISKVPYWFNEAYDVHRTMLDNEIIAESDYPTYEENWDAMRVLGPIIESKGFKPHYYYSGGKSIHAHMYFDWNCLLTIDKFLQEKLLSMFRYKYLFKRKFIRFLREKVISCWDMNLKQFDVDLAKPKHLIRTELSKNKLGYKTFIGRSYKDLSFIPYICNEENRIYPSIANAWDGEVKFSKLHDIQDLVQEFLDSLDTELRKSKIRRKSASLLQWFGHDQKLPGCVEFILSDDFVNVGDGFKRASFIIANELKRRFGPEIALEKLLNWNDRMGNPVRKNELNYSVNENQEYTLTCKFVHDFLRGIGVHDLNEKCNHKV